MKPLDDTDPDITPPYAPAPERPAEVATTHTPSSAPAVEPPAAPEKRDAGPRRDKPPSRLVSIGGRRVRRRTLALVAALWITVFAGGWMIGALASGPSDDTVQTAPRPGATSDETGPSEGSAAPDPDQRTPATSPTSAPSPSIEDDAGSSDDAGERRSTTTTRPSRSDAEDSDDASDPEDPATSTTTTTERTTTTTEPTTTTTEPEPGPQAPSATES